MANNERNSNGAGKGDRDRTSNRKLYEENFDKIFKKKTKPNPEDYKQSSWINESCDDE